jgi:hypothetical protein
LGFPSTTCSSICSSTQQAQEALQLTEVEVAWGQEAWMEALYCSTVIKQGAHMRTVDKPAPCTVMGHLPECPTLAMLCETSYTTCMSCERRQCHWTTREFTTRPSGMLDTCGLQRPQCRC